MTERVECGACGMPILPDEPTRRDDAADAFARAFNAALATVEEDM
jgi:hypothetical protein